MKHPFFVASGKVIFLFGWIFLSIWFWQHIEFPFAVFITIASQVLLVFLFYRWNQLEMETVLFSIVTISVLIFLFYFKEEFQIIKEIDLSFVRHEKIQRDPKDLKTKFFQLDGYHLDREFSFSTSVYQKSHDHKGRDNSHTSHYVLVPLRLDFDPNSEIQFFALEPNFYRLNLWFENRMNPNFAVFLPPSKDHQTLLKQYSEKYMVSLSPNLRFVHLQDSPEVYVQTKKGFIYLVVLTIPSIFTIWFMGSSFRVWFRRRQADSSLG